MVASARCQSRAILAIQCQWDAGVRWKKIVGLPAHTDNVRHQRPVALSRSKQKAMTCPGRIDVLWFAVRLSHAVWRGAGAAKAVIFRKDKNKTNSRWNNIDSKTKDGFTNITLLDMNWGSTKDLSPYSTYTLYKKVPQTPYSALQTTRSVGLCCNNGILRFLLPYQPIFLNEK